MFKSASTNSSNKKFNIDLNLSQWSTWSEKSLRQYVHSQFSQTCYAGSIFSCD